MEYADWCTGYLPLAEITVTTGGMVGRAIGRSCGGFVGEVPKTGVQGFDDPGEHGSGIKGVIDVLGTGRVLLHG